MNFEFTIDFESQSINLIVDNSISITAYKEPDNSVTYSRLGRLESEELQEKVKQLFDVLFSINEI